MAIEFQCPSCGSEIEADDTLAGTQCECPQCSRPILVPQQGIYPGMALGSYRIERKLGVGGMGEVWLAQHTTMQRAVALKILSPALTSDSEFISRFMHEVKTAAMLEHPNVITAFDAGAIDGVHYLAVSYVDGEDLGERLARQGAIPEREALLIVRGVAEALGYAWSRFGMLHRDVKPANIMLGSDDTPRLLDMGISKTMAEDVQLTMSGYIVGTPDYMSPEQAKAEDTIDCRADIYSLGATLYHLVTGTVPFHGTSVMGVLTKHLTEPLESPRHRNPAVSEGCASLVETMMAKEAAERPASWESVIKDIDRVLAGHMPASRRPQAGHSMVGRMHPEDLRNIRTGQHRLAAQKAAREAKYKHMAAPSAKTSGTKAAVITVLLLGAIVGFFALFREFSPSRHSRVPPPVSPPTGGSQSPPVRDKTAELWDYAMRFARENPTEYDLAIGHFRRVKEVSAGTKYELQSDVEISRMQAARREATEQAVADALLALEEQAQPLVNGQDYTTAAALYRNYDGPMATETSADRERLAAAYDQQARQRDDRQARAAHEARAKIAALLDDAAGELLEGKTAEAVTRAEALAKEHLPGTEGEKVSAALGLLRDLGRVDELVLKTFEAQVNREIELSVRGQTHRLKIVGIRKDEVQAERRMGAAVVGVVFTMRQLPPEEKCRRLKDIASPELCALFEGLCAATRNRFEEATDLLAGAGVLADPLRTALDKRRLAWREERAAEALFAVLHRLRVPGRNPGSQAALHHVRTARLAPRDLSIAQAALETYKRAYGETTFATEQAPFTDELTTLLVTLTAPEEEAPATTLAAGRAPVAAPASLPLSTSPYRSSPDKLRAALTRLNPGLKGGAFKMEGRQIVSVAFDDCPALKDITPLRGLSLTFLKLRKCKNITDYSPLAGMPLRELNLQLSSFKNDCMPLLAAMPLEILNVNGTGVSDASVLRGKPLRKLWASQLRDLEPFRGMPLEELYISPSYHVTDLRPLAGIPIKVLRLNFAEPLSNIEGIETLLSLEDFGVGYAGHLTDISPVAHLKALKRLDFTKTRVANLTPLQGLVALERLALGYTLVADVTPLKGLVALKGLNLQGTLVSDLSPLKGLSSLKGINILETPVADIAALHGKKLESLACEIRNLKNLDDIRALRSMRSLVRIHPGKDFPAMSIADFWKRYNAGEFE